MLQKKMWRELRENKAAYLACITVIAIGLMLYVSMSVIFEGLTEARDNFYNDYRFADGFASLRRGLSQTQVERLAAVEGVARLEGRMVKDVRVFSPEREDNVYLRLVSIRPEQATRLNDVMLLAGAMPAAGSQGIIVDPDFLEANGLQPGDTIPVIIAGKQAELTVTGAAISPEFVYALRNPMDIYPDPATFGVAYLPLGVMQNLFGEKSLNDIVFTLAPGHTYEDVEGRLKPRLEPYGLESIYAREDQFSAAMLRQELQGVQSMVTSVPLLFLIVAATILYILLKRMVEQQRGQIGILKALGYSSREILFHYISYALIIGALGGLLGALLGFWLSYPLMTIYETFFKLPGLTGRFSLYYLITGVLFSTGFGVLAGYFGSREVLQLQPAEAMRPPAPPLAKQPLLEGWRIYWDSLTVQGKMATRNAFRNLGRSFFTLIGVMFAFSLIATTGYFLSMFDVLIFDQFTRVQTHDVKVVFERPIDRRDARLELSRLPGVNRFEAYLEAPATLKQSWLEKDTVILGLEQDSEMYNLLTKDGVKVALPTEGLILSQNLAQGLQARVGSRLEIESPYAKASPVYCEVVDIIPQYLGTNAYMDIDALGRLLGQGNISTAALLSVEEGVFPYLKDRYQEAKNVFSVEEKGAMLKKFNELMESYSFTFWILALFGMLTGFAVIYNSGVVSLSERKRELASLRVIGMTPAEVLQVLSFEQWFISFFGMLAGVPMTMLFLQGMASMMDTDLFTFPVKFELQPFIIGTVGTVVSIWFTQRFIYRKIGQLSMVEALKDRE
ncbi:MAG: FtsX-like permease family protein [Clostridia bacterium]|nr:FtsX-like permease family protein [Clostridia bacterium]